MPQQPRPTTPRTGRCTDASLSAVLVAVVIGAAGLAVTPRPAIAAGAGDDTGARAERHVQFHQGPTAGYYLAARHAERRRDADRAADFMLTAAARDPDNMLLRHRAFLFLISAGRFDEAVAVGESVLAIRESSPVGNLAIAIDAARGGDFTRAVEHVERLDPERYGAFLRPATLAWARAGAGDVEGARETLEDLAGSEGFRSLYNLHSALIEDLEGNNDAARAYYEELLEREDEPSLRAVQLVGNFLERQNDTEAAADLYRRYRDSLSAMPLLHLSVTTEGAPAPLIGSAREGMAEAMFNISSALHDDREATVSLVYARMAQALAPKNPVIDIIIAEILEQTGRHDLAAATYGELVQDPKFGRAARQRMARNLGRDERSEEAIGILAELVATEREAPEPAIELGHMLRVDERFDEAVEAYDLALERIEEIRPRHWRLFYARGVAYEQKGDWESAERDLLRSLELDDDQPYVLNYLAYSWIDQGVNLDRAEEMIVRAVEMRPDDGFIVDSLGWLYYKTGRYERAVETLERAVALEPVDPTINEHLGDAYWRVGRIHEARFQWRRALAEQTDDGRVAKIRQKMECGLDSCDHAAAVQ